MGRVVAISGGNLQTTEKLNMYALKLSGKETPNVLFIGTASEEGRDSFDLMISDVGYDGMALESETAFVESRGQQFIIGSRHEAEAWLFSNHNKKPLEVIPC